VRGVLVVIREAVIVGGGRHGVEVFCASGAGAAAAETAADKVFAAAEAAHEAPQDGDYDEGADDYADYYGPSVFQETLVSS
jgi:hypothetical protein